MIVKFVNVVIALAIAFGLYSLYAAFCFLTIEDISTPEQIPRLRYDRNCWAAIFCGCALMAVVLGVVRRRLPPGK